MPPIKHTALFDFPAYEAAIKQAKQSSDEFGKVLSTTIDRLAVQQRELNAALKEYSSILKNFNSLQNDAASSLKRYNSEVDISIAEQKELIALKKGLKQVDDVQRASLVQLQAELAGLTAAYKKLKPDQADYVDQVKKIKERIGEVVPAINTMNQALKNAKTSATFAEGSYKKMQQELTTLRNRLRELPNAFDQLTGKINKNNKEAVELSKRIQQLDTTLKGADKSMGIFVRNVGNYQSAFKGLGSSILSTVGAIVGIQSGFEALKFVFNTNLQFDSLNKSIELVSGNAQEFAINQQFLARVSDHLGLEIIGLATAFKTFYAASTQSGVSADKTRQIFEQVSKVGARLKLSQDSINGVFTAFGQIISKGTVQAEELRGQLGERIPGAFSIAAKAIGVTQQELNKMLKAGEVISADFLPKFATELEKTFGGGTERVEGLQAAVNRFSNALKDVANDESGGLNIFFGKLINFFTDALKGADKFFGFINDYLDPAAKKVRTLSEIFNDSYNSQAGKSVDETTKALEDNRQALLKTIRDVKILKAEYLQFKSIANFRNLESAQTAMFEQQAATNGVRQALRDSGKAKPTTDPINPIDPEKARIAAEKAAKAYEDYIRKQQQLAQKLMEIQLKENELKLVREEQNENDFQQRKFEIIGEYAGKATELENRLGSRADQARIDDLKKKVLDATIDLEEYTKKKAPKSSTVAGPARAANTGSTDAAAQGYTDLAKRIDEFYTLQIKQEEAVFKIAKRNSRDKYLTEKERLEALIKLNADAANEIGTKDLALFKKYQDQKEILEAEKEELRKIRAKEVSDAIIEFSSAAAFGLLEVISSAQQAKTDQRIAQLEKERDREIAAAGQNAAARARIDADYNRKIAKEKKKAAENDKKVALFNIAINTAVAVAKAAPNPVLIALALALGVLQAAIVAAKPIPQFRKGTGSAPKGKAIVGEDGFELIERRGKKYLSRNSASLVDLEGGERIHTHEASKKMLARMLVNADGRLEPGSVHQAIAESIRQGKKSEQAAILAKAIAGTISLEQLQKAFDSSVKAIPINQTIYDEQGVRRREMRENSQVTYLNKQHSI